MRTGRPLVAVLAVTALAACAPGATSAPPSPVAEASGFRAEQLAKIDDAARRSLTNGVTGVVVSIDDPARGTLLKAYGAADTAGTPLTPQAHYRIASVTKTFTADAVLRLVDQGRVRLDDPIARYVAGVPNGERITVRDLLAMRSGAYDFVGDPAFLRAYTRPRRCHGPPTGRCRSCARTPPTSPRRTRRRCTTTRTTSCSTS